MTEELDKAVRVLEELMMFYAGNLHKQGFVLNALRQLEALWHLERITKKE